MAVALLAIIVDNEKSRGQERQSMEMHATLLLGRMEARMVRACRQVRRRYNVKRTPVESRRRRLQQQ